MNCEKCGGPSTVISTRDVLNLPGARCRRRACVAPKCRHRWYTLAPAEIALPHEAVNWSGSAVIIGARRRVVECVETGVKYPTALDAASAAFVSRATMHRGLKEGTLVGGRQYRWSSTPLDNTLGLSSINDPTPYNL
jgi:hypothetical protein